MKRAESEPASFQLAPEGRALVSGTLGFPTVVALLPSGSEAIAQGRASAIDLAGVTSSDSAGLALLIEWLSVARAAGCSVRYENIPAQLHQLAALSDADELLGPA